MQRVAGEVRDRMRRITDPYLRERLADLDELAGRLLSALSIRRCGRAGRCRRAIPPAILLARRLGPAGSAGLARARHRGVAIEEASPAGHAAIVARALGLPALGGVRGMLERRATGRRGGAGRRRGPAHAAAGAGGAAGLSCARWRRGPRARPAGPCCATSRRHRRRHAGPADAECRAGPGTGAARRHGRRWHRAVPHRDRHAGARRGGRGARNRRRSTPGCWMPPATGRCCSARWTSVPTNCCRETATDEENPAMGWRRCASGSTARPCCDGSCARCCWPPAGGELSVMFPMVATVANSVPRGRCCWPRPNGCARRRQG